MQQLFFLLAQSNSFDTDANNARSIFLWIFVFTALIIAGRWATFVKAGYPGWTSIFPGYQGLVLLEIAEKPLWWFLMPWITIPIYIIFLLLNINELFLWKQVFKIQFTITSIFQVLISVSLARTFGRSIFFGLGLVFLPFIFYPILGFTQPSRR
jgi:hypothetical protein